jgi:hypothetical protein
MALEERTDRSAQTKPSRQPKKRTTKVNDLVKSEGKHTRPKKKNTTYAGFSSRRQSTMGNPDGFPPMMIANGYRHRLSSRENASGCPRRHFSCTRCRGPNSQSLHSHHKPLSRSAQNIWFRNLNANVTRITKNLPPPAHSSYATARASSSSLANSLEERNSTF